MVEKQITVKLVAADLQSDLATDEGKPATEFEQECPDVIDKLLLDLHLTQWLGDTQEVEQVRVTGGLPSQVGVARRHHRCEIGDGLPCPSVQLTVDLQSQDVAAPSLRDRLPAYQSRTSGWPSLSRSTM